MTIDIEKLERINLKPGEILAVHLQESIPYDDDDAHGIRIILEGIFGTGKVLVCSPGVRFEGITKPTEAVI
jgi:hypothetical protein